MSDRDQETVETKAGHPPALKVGGMRVSQRSRSPGAEGATHDPENPQMPPKESEEGDTQVRGVGGLQSQPKDLLVKGTSGVPVTAKDLGIREEGIRHTHDKGIGTTIHPQQGQFTPKEHAGLNRHVGEPRNHGTNH